jgi:hypothetical protein
MARVFIHSFIRLSTHPFTHAVTTHRLNIYGVHAPVLTPASKMEETDIR